MTEADLKDSYNEMNEAYQLAQGKINKLVIYSAQIEQENNDLKSELAEVNRLRGLEKDIHEQAQADFKDDSERIIKLTTAVAAANLRAHLVEADRDALKALNETVISAESDAREARNRAEAHASKSLAVATTVVRCLASVAALLEEELK